MCTSVHLELAIAGACSMELHGGGLSTFSSESKGHRSCLSCYNRQGRKVEVLKSKCNTVSSCLSSLKCVYCIWVIKMIK